MDMLIRRIWDSGPKLNLISIAFALWVLKRLLYGVPLAAEESLDHTFLKTSVVVQWLSTLIVMWKCWGVNSFLLLGESRESIWTTSFTSKMVLLHIAQMSHRISSTSTFLEIDSSHGVRTTHGQPTLLIFFPQTTSYGGTWRRGCTTTTHKPLKPWRLTSVRKFEESLLRCAAMSSQTSMCASININL